MTYKSTIYIYTYTHNNDLDLKFAHHVLVFTKPNKTTSFHYKKKWCFVTSLATQFFNCNDHLQLIIYMVQLITTQLQFCCNNSFSTTMKFPYDYKHNVKLMSFFIHSSKFNMWHYKIFW